MQSKLLLGTILIVLIIHKSVALPLSYYNKTSNGGYTCCVTPTASCISGLIGSCIDCPLAETPITALACAAGIASVAEDCIKCYNSECSSCPSSMIEWYRNINKYNVPMVTNSKLSMTVSDTPAPTPAPAPSPTPPHKDSCDASGFVGDICKLGTGLEVLANGAADFINAFAWKSQSSITKSITDRGFDYLSSITNCGINNNISDSNLSDYFNILREGVFQFVDDDEKSRFDGQIALSQFVNGYDSIYTDSFHFHSGDDVNPYNIIHLSKIHNLETKQFSVTWCQVIGEFGLAPDIIIVHHHESSWFGFDQNDYDTMNKIPATLPINGKKLLEDIFTYNTITTLASSLPFKINVTKAVIPSTNREVTCIRTGNYGCRTKNDCCMKSASSYICDGYTNDGKTENMGRCVTKNCKPRGETCMSNNACCSGKCNFFAFYDGENYVTMCE